MKDSRDNLLQKAQQCDPQAIKALIADMLENKGLDINIAVEDRILKILIESNHFLDGQSLFEKLYEELNQIPFELIDSMELYKKRGSNSISFLIRKMEFIKTKTKDSSNPKEQGDSTVDNIGERKISEFKEIKVHKANRYLGARQLSNKDSNVTKKINFAALLPLNYLVNVNLQENLSLRFLLFFGLFPWILGLLGLHIKLENVAWLLGIYYSSIWGVILYSLIKPIHFSWSDTLKCISFTTFLGIPLLLSVQQIAVFKSLYTIALTDMSLPSRLISFVLGVGFLEEICKALPVCFFLLSSGKLKEPHSSAFYGAMSGLGFAIAEGVNYSILYASGLLEGNLSFGSYILINTIRFVSLPLFHAIWAGIVGYFIGLSAIYSQKRFLFIFLGITISACLHGFYNAFSNSLLGLFILVATIFLFVAYLDQSHQISNEIKQAEARHQVSKGESKSKRKNDMRQSEIITIEEELNTYSSENLREAISELNKAIFTNSNTPFLYNRRGIIFLRLNDLNHAISDFDKAIRLNPDFTGQSKVFL